MSPEDRAESLFRTVHAPDTGYLERRGPGYNEILGAIRAAIRKRGQP